MTDISDLQYLAARALDARATAEAAHRCGPGSARNEAAALGRAGGYLFRALELAYDRGVEHGRSIAKVDP